MLQQQIRIPPEVLLILSAWLSRAVATVSAMPRSSEFRLRLSQAAESLGALIEAGQAGDVVLIKPAITFGKLKFMLAMHYEAQRMAPSNSRAVEIHVVAPWLSDMKALEMTMMEEAIRINVPEAIRKIFAEWAADFDNAPSFPGVYDPSELATLYKAMARGGERLITRRALARICAGALLNSQMGWTQDMQSEGEEVMRWIQPIVGSDAELDEFLSRELLGWPDRI